MPPPLQHAKEARWEEVWGLAELSLETQAQELLKPARANTKRATSNEEHRAAVFLLLLDIYPAGVSGTFVGHSFPGVGQGHVMSEVPLPLHPPTQARGWGVLAQVSAANRQGLEPPLAGISACL